MGKKRTENQGENPRPKLKKKNLVVVPVHDLKKDPDGEDVVNVHVVVVGENVVETEADEKAEIEIEEDVAKIEVVTVTVTVDAENVNVQPVTLEMIQKKEK